MMVHRYGWHIKMSASQITITENRSGVNRWITADEIRFLSPTPLLSLNLLTFLQFLVTRMPRDKDQERLCRWRPLTALTSEYLGVPRLAFENYSVSDGDGRDTDRPRQNSEPMSRCSPPVQSDLSDDVTVLNRTGR
jgi:hypothetical protein